MERKIRCDSYCFVWLILRGEQKDSSDIDLLVEFEDKAMTFDNYMDLKFTLEDLFEKSVDLVIIDDIKPALKSSIIRSSKYAL